MKYQVKDNQTGESFTYEGSAPPTSSDIEQYKASQQAQQSPQQIDSSGGLGNIPYVGPMIRGITNYYQDVLAGAQGGQATTSAEQLANQANDMLKRAQTEKDPNKKMYYLNEAGRLGQGGSQASQQALSAYSPDINQPYVQRGFQDFASNVAGLISIPEQAKAVYNLGKGAIGGIKNLDPYKSLPAKMEKLAADAAASGKSMSADDFLNTFKQNVQKMYDPNASKVGGEWNWASPGIEDYVKSVEDYVRSGKGTLTPQKLIDLRRYFAQQLPSGIFQKAMMGRTPATNIYDAARYTATNAAKDITPGLARTDTIYQLLRNILGPNELSALERMGIAGVGVPTAFKLLQGLFGGGGPSSFSAGTAPVQ